MHTARGLIVKDEFWEERNVFHRYGHWRPSLTEKGERVARDVKREVLEYFEEWAHLVCDVHGAREGS